MMNKFEKFLCNVFAVKRSSATNYILAAAGVAAINLLSLGQMLADNFDHKTSEVRYLLYAYWHL